MFFHHHHVAFGKLNLQVKYKGMGNTNHMLMKVLIHPLERIQKNIQGIPMNCTEQSSVNDNQNDPS